MIPESHSAPFAPTRWTLVLRARGETPQARAALSELCEAYYQPVLRFLRRQGQDEDTARDSAQEFFARVLRQGGFDGADPGRGRFRSYLLGALKHFLADLSKRERRIKRGGGATFHSLDLKDDDGPAALELADASGLLPDAVFDRAWALAVMERGLLTLEKEFAANGKANQFEILKPWLMGDGPSMSQAEAGRRLGLSEGAVKVAIHRLRCRFREAIRAEIVQTLRDPSLADEELRHLIRALA